MGGVNVKITMIEALMQKVAPHLCFGCSKIGTPLCLNCKYNITSEPYLGCILCGKVSPNGICAQHDVPVCKAWIVGQRVSVLKRAINAYKFENVKAIADPLIDMISSLIPLLPESTIIVPIPTASSHIRQRGYDHIDILARKLSIQRGLPLKRYLKRSSSKTQHRLTKAERIIEADSSFYIGNTHTIDPYTPVLLLDDIITTGSTVTSAARALSNAGVKTIFVAALAYQPLD